MKQLFTGLFLALFLTCASAQQEVPTVKMWKLETEGIGGWGAASKAIRVRATLEKMKGVGSVVFDTTGRGYLRMRKKLKPTKESINKVLAGMKPKVTVKKLELVKFPKKMIKYELTVMGVSWQSSCIEIRGILEKIDGIARVHVYGSNSKVIVHTNKKGVITSKSVETLLKANPKLKLRKFKRI